MTAPWTLVEPCCGTASLTLHLLGAKQSLLPYQGSKWRFRRQLAALARELGFEGAPDSVQLSDPGPFGRTMHTVLSAADLPLLVAVLRGFEATDPRTLWDLIQNRQIPSNDTQFAAEHLFLQRLAFSGKAVGIRDGKWVSPGFNKTSAYGLPATERFGGVSPMLPSLLRVLRGYLDTLQHPQTLSVRWGGAYTVGFELHQPTLVYLDPNYQNSTRYPNGNLTRAEVVELARMWQTVGAAVLVSEAEPIPELLASGFGQKLLSSGRGDTSPFRGKNPEYVTYCPARL